MSEKEKEKAISFVTDRPAKPSRSFAALTPRVHAIFDETIARANEKHKAKFGESIYAPGLRDWAQSLGRVGPPPCWPCGFVRVPGDPLSWQPFDWTWKLIGEPWHFKRPLDEGDLCFNVWGDAGDDDCVRFDDEKFEPGASWRKEYFYSLGEVLDETVDPLGYSTVLARLLEGRDPSPPDAGAALAA
jgi:hypothetical protein